MRRREDRTAGDAAASGSAPPAGACRSRPRGARPRRSPRPRCRRRSAAARVAIPRCSRCRRSCRRVRPPCRWRPGSADGGPLALATALAGEHLRGDVAPPDHGHHTHLGPSGDSASDGRGQLAVARRAAFEGEPEAVRGGLRLRGQLRVVGLGEVDEAPVAPEVVGQQLRMPVEAEAGRSRWCRTGGRGSRSGRTSRAPRPAWPRTQPSPRRTRSSARRRSARRPRAR